MLLPSRDRLEGSGVGARVKVSREVDRRHIVVGKCEIADVRCRLREAEQPTATKGKAPLKFEVRLYDSISV